MDFAAGMLKIFGLVVLCHFYWELALRILHREHFLNRYILPVLTGFFVYFLVVSGLGISDVEDNWIECMRKCLF